MIPRMCCRRDVRGETLRMRALGAFNSELRKRGQLRLKLSLPAEVDAQLRFPQHEARLRRGTFKRGTETCFASRGNKDHTLQQTLANARLSSFYSEVGPEKHGLASSPSS